MNAWMSSVSTTGADHGGSPCFALRSSTPASSFPTSSSGTRSVMVSPPDAWSMSLWAGSIDKSTERSSALAILAQTEHGDQSDDHGHRDDQPRDPVAARAIDDVPEKRCGAERSHAAEQMDPRDRRRRRRAPGELDGQRAVDAGPREGGEPHHDGEERHQAERRVR